LDSSSRAPLRYCHLQRSICIFHSVVPWPLQDMVLLRGFCARIHHPFIAPSHLHCPHDCTTIARLWRNIRRPPDPPFFCVPNTSYNIGKIAISCNGQVVPFFTGARARGCSGQAWIRVLTPPPRYCRLQSSVCIFHSVVPYSTGAPRYCHLQGSICIFHSVVPYPTDARARGRGGQAWIRVLGRRVRPRRVMSVYFLCGSCGPLC